MSQQPDYERDRMEVLGAEPEPRYRAAVVPHDVGGVPAVFDGDDPMTLPEVASRLNALTVGEIVVRLNALVAENERLAAELAAAKAPAPVPPDLAALRLWAERISLDRPCRGREVVAVVDELARLRAGAGVAAAAGPCNNCEALKAERDEAGRELTKARSGRDVDGEIVDTYLACCSRLAQERDRHHHNATAEVVRLTAELDEARAELSKARANRVTAWATVEDLRSERDEYKARCDRLACDPPPGPACSETDRLVAILEAAGDLSPHGRAYLIACLSTEEGGSAC